MKRPAFQFYPGDWRRDAALQSCSLEARGLWVELVCLMHEGQPYGHLALNNQPLNGPTIARLVGISTLKYRKLVAELLRSGVASLAGDTLFSRRMVRDEDLRQVRAAAGVRSLENPNVPRPKDTHKGYPEGPPEGGNGVPSPSSSSASAGTTPTPPPPGAELACGHAALLARFPGPGAQRIAVTEFLLGLPANAPALTWIGVLRGCLDGMGCKPATPDAVAVACLDYPNTDAGKAGKYDPRFFRACVESAMNGGRKPIPATAKPASDTPILRRLA